jgi:carboxymethylenebutenolidase
MHAFISIRLKTAYVQALMPIAGPLSAASQSRQREIDPVCDLKGCGTNPDGRSLPGVTDVERRRFIKGLAGLPLATVLAYPELARAAAGRMKQVAVATPSGGTALAALALPERLPAPAVLLVPEWWGLNDQIKAVAQELAAQGYIALAADIYDGEVGTTREEAMALVKAFDPAAGLEKLTALARWLKDHEAGTGKVGTVGWCFGGGWSLNVSLATPVDATVIYYGNVTKTPERGDGRRLRGGNGRRRQDRSCRALVRRRPCLRQSDRLALRRGGRTGFLVAHADILPRAPRLERHAAAGTVTNSSRRNRPSSSAASFERQPDSRSASSAAPSSARSPSALCTSACSWRRQEFA